MKSERTRKPTSFVENVYEGSKMKISKISLEHLCRNALKMAGAALESLKKEKRGRFVRSE